MADKHSPLEMRVVLARFYRNCWKLVALQVVVATAFGLIVWASYLADQAMTPCP